MLKKKNIIKTGDNNFAHFVICKGLNYKGVCKNDKCIAGKHKEPILLPRGMDTFRPNEDKAEKKIKCPGCGLEFELEAFYFYKCKVTIIYQKKRAKSYWTNRTRQKMMMS